MEEKFSGLVVKIQHLNLIMGGSPLTAISMPPKDHQPDDFTDTKLARSIINENIMKDSIMTDNIRRDLERKSPEPDTKSLVVPTSAAMAIPQASGGSSTSAIKPLAFIRNSKRSSSASNDFLYERDRFRARLHNFNINSDDANDDDQEECDVCDIIGTKTTKLNVVKDELEPEEDLDGSSDISPLDTDSSFYQSLMPSIYSRLHEKIDIKSVDLGDVQYIFGWYFNKPLPPTHSMFPWLHGLNVDNFAQRQFFLQQQREQQQVEALTLDDLESKPTCRFLMTVNADVMENDEPILKNNTLINEILCPVDISRAEVHSLLKNIVLKVFPNEGPIDKILETFLKDIFRLNYLPLFLNLDPDRGVSLRNFHIQMTKTAICSDFIVYCFKEENQDFADSIARILWLAQRFEQINTMDSNLANMATRPHYKVLSLNHYQEVENNDKLFSINLKNKMSSKNIDINKVVKLQLKYLQFWDSEYSIKEKVETIKMSSASTLNGELYCGNSWDYQNFLNFKYSRKKDYLSFKKPINIRNLFCNPLNSIVTSNFNSNDLIETILPLPNLNYKLFVHCFNEGNFPDDASLDNLLALFNDYSDDTDKLGEFYHLTFPSSGAIGIGDIKKENISSILNLCKLLYLISTVKSLDTLVYCSDGYTELSLLNLCYIIYSLDCLVGDAIINLHLKFGRPFYIFNTDVQILEKLEPILRKYSPVAMDVNWKSGEKLSDHEINKLLLSPKTFNSFKLDYTNGCYDGDLTSSSSSSCSSDGSDSFIQDAKMEVVPDWYKEVEGSLPSRILPYLYLGSLKHANCLPLLKELGITKVISVGEPLMWIDDSKFKKNHDIVVDELNGGDIEIHNIVPHDRLSTLSVDQVVKVNNLQDDGIDQLESSLPAILKYIDDEYQKSNGQTKILIHCRVGVSRSATVVIAEVMRRLKINLPKAYLYVRVRRLNIIIQPNLKFLYELFKWEELHKQDDKEYLREIDWYAMCREITLLNNPYLSGCM